MKAERASFSSEEKVPSFDTRSNHSFCSTSKDHFHRKDDINFDFLNVNVTNYW